MQTVLNENESDAWMQIAPLLDAAMAGLNETDRHAVVLRFFDGKSIREVAAALGANEDAAKKRVSRALEKLRNFFAKHGVSFNHGHHRRGDFSELRSSRAGGAGKICDRRGASEGRGGQRFNFNPHQRSIENYGMDQSKNGNRRRRSGDFGNRHDDDNLD